MFNLFKSKPKGEVLTFKIDGMHCTSCALNIDGDLEDTVGIISSNTSYAKSITKVEYDPQQINSKQIQNIIKKTGYTVKSS